MPRPDADSTRQSVDIEIQNRLNPWTYDKVATTGADPLFGDAGKSKWLTPQASGDYQLTNYLMASSKNIPILAPGEGSIQRNAIFSHKVCWIFNTFYVFSFNDLFYIYFTHFSLLYHLLFLKFQL